MTPRATALPIQLCIDTRNFMGVPVVNRPEERGFRVHFRDGGELHDWLYRHFGDDWKFEFPIYSPRHWSWSLVADDALVGVVHAYRDMGAVLTRSRTRHTP
mgnify:CR=1 FL=1